LITGIISKNSQQMVQAVHFILTRSTY
jgi:hypothetical protein